VSSPQLSSKHNSASKNRNKLAPPNSLAITTFNNKSHPKDKEITIKQFGSERKNLHKSREMLHVEETIRVADSKDIQDS